MKNSWLQDIIGRESALAQRGNDLSMAERVELLAIETQLKHVFSCHTVSVATPVPVPRDTLAKVIRDVAEAAALVFAVRGWTWVQTHPRTPGVEDIRELFTALHRDLGVEIGSRHGSGRLMVERTDRGVEFVLELGYYSS